MWFRLPESDHAVKKEMRQKEMRKKCERNATATDRNAMVVLQLAGVGTGSLKGPKMATRPAIFKWRQTEPVLILCAVRWYLRYSLSLRDVEELLDERGLQADHTTVWRWVQRYVRTEATHPASQADQ